jgi:hypothetical protein
VVYRLADPDRDRRVEFVSADDRFAYAFASFAGSGFPLRIWTYAAGRLSETTRAYPTLIAKDAAKQWRWYRTRRAHGEVRGLLAAWAADQCLLGRCQEALTRLRRLSQPASYVRKLRAFLRRTGYLR